MARRRTYYGRKSSKVFGRILREWRKEVHLSLEEAANRLGMKCASPGSYLSQIERGLRPIPEGILINVPNVYKRQPEEVLRAAYYPQLPFPILTAVVKPTALPKEIEDYLQDIEKQLADADKRELARYAAFLILRRRLTVTH